MSINHTQYRQGNRQDLQRKRFSATTENGGKDAPVIDRQIILAQILVMTGYPPPPKAV